MHKRTLRVGDTISYHVGAAPNHKVYDEVYKITSTTPLILDNDFCLLVDGKLNDQVWITRHNGEKFNNNEYNLTTFYVEEEGLFNCSII